MTKRSTSDAHKRTRKDHASETAEDYVEAIADILDAKGSCRVVDLSERFGVSHVTVIQVVKRLEKSGYVVTVPYQPLELTRAGLRLAQDCRERHDIVYRFLLAIGVEERVALIDSEGIEHHVSPETLERFRKIAQQQSPAQGPSEGPAADPDPGGNPPD